MSETPTLKPCPFCGETPDPATAFQEADTCKWGAVHCGCGARGPDTRTEYDMKPGAPWNADAAEEWNRRAAPPAPGARSPEPDAEMMERLRTAYAEGRKLSHDAALVFVAYAAVNSLPARAPAEGEPT